MTTDTLYESLLGLRKVEAIYSRVAEISEYVYKEEELARREEYIRELEFLLQGVKETDTHLTIFNHKTYSPELEVGHSEFWGPLPEGNSSERMVSILGLLHKDYAAFPYESVDWFTDVLQKIPFKEKVNIKIHHCGMQFMRTDGKPIRIFSQGIPIQNDEERNFIYTLNYVQNIHHLIKNSFPYYWIRLSYGQQNQYVQTFHSESKEHNKHDLLSEREKEILLLIAEGLDTKEIAGKLFISINTIGNHRSNMIERLGVRDSTALVQLAKMTGMI
jgi:DNA-binding CsgD family transcriptional regulator